MSSNRYVGVKNDNIHIVTTTAFHPVDESMTMVQIPSEYANIAAADIITNFRIKDGVLRPRRMHKPASQLKLAFVGNWKMQCGIATYSESLLPEITKHVGDVKLFIEHNDNPTSNVKLLGDLTLKDNQVISCWRRGDSLQNLVKELKAYDPDVIWIQHEFGIWPNAGHWLAMLSQLSGYRIIVTMHSVFHHRDKTIVEAAMPEIVVHLAGAKHVLQTEKGINSPIYVIPHGCNPVVDASRLWNFYKSEHTIVQFGFGFRYKGWEQTIKATARLKERYSDVFFTGLFSESSFNKVDHQVYYNELTNLIEHLGLQENVALIRGYQSDAALDSYLRTNQVVVFPYISHPEHEVFGVSGAARYAMSKLIPIVTSNVNHFSDIPTVKASTTEELANAIELMFSDTNARNLQIQKQMDYLNDNTWVKIAQKYIKLFEDKL